LIAEAERTALDSLRKDSKGEERTPLSSLLAINDAVGKLGKTPNRAREKSRDLLWRLFLSRSTKGLEPALNLEFEDLAHYTADCFFRRRS
jgi:hypothetical protein